MAANECQAMQFIPLVILLQLFLSDIIRGIEAFPEVFQWISNVLPLTHANILVRNVLLKNWFSGVPAAGFYSILLFYSFSGVAATGSRASVAIRVKRAIV